MTDAEALTKDWWRTAIIEMRPGVIRFGGYPIEDLIGRISFAQMIWLMTRGELPSRAQGELLEAALTAGVDHGPQAPSIAIARMAATCGVGLNNAIASALNVLGDVHGAAGEQTVELFHAIAERQARGEAQDAAVDAALDDFTAQSGKFVPGYGHRVHPIDPRARKGGKAHSDEYRRRNRRHLCRAWLPGTARAGTVLPVARRRNSRPRLGADAARRTQQGSDPAPVHSDVRRAGRAALSGVLS